MRLLFLCGILFTSSVSWARDDVRTSTTRGFFSLAFITGYQESSLLNSDGSAALYKGYLYGAGLDVALFTTENSAFRAYLNYLTGDAKGEPDSYKTVRSETMGGLKVFPASWLYVAAGMGRVTNKVTAPASTEQSLGSTFSGFGMGAELPVSENMYLSVSAWYKGGAIKKDDNPTFTGNSFFESKELQVQLTWSPPTTTINVNRNK